MRSGARHPDPDAAGARPSADVCVLPGRVEATNNACERDLRPAVIQRKNTNGYRAMWSAQGEAAVRTVVATARLKAGPSTFGTVLSTITA